MSSSINGSDQSINYDELDQITSNDKKIDTESEITVKSSSRITQVPNMSLSMGKSSINSEQSQSNNKIKESILTIKTSNIPGPVGLLPILVR
jgi:hypothetical protein